jgi:hypothetical protein
MSVPNIILPPTPSVPGSNIPTVVPTPPVPNLAFQQPAGNFTIADQLLAAKTLRDNYYLALINDSLYPQPNYSLQDETVSRDEWRAALLKQIQDLQALIAMLDLTEITTIQV